MCQLKLKLVFLKKQTLYEDSFDIILIIVLSYSILIENYAFSDDFDI